MSSTCPHCGSLLGFGHIEPIHDPFVITKSLEVVDQETLRLAQLVADMEPPPTDTKSIEDWAKRLAADISKGRD